MKRTGWVVGFLFGLAALLLGFLFLNERALRSQRESELAAKAAELSELRGELESLSQEKLDKEQMLNTHIETLEGTITDLNAKVLQAHSELDSSQNEISTKTDAVRKLEAENESLKLELLKKDRDMLKLEEQIHALQREKMAQTENKEAEAKAVLE